MYVISLVTEHDVAAGGCYKVIHKDIYGLVDIIDDVGEEYTLSSVEYVEAGKESYAEHQNKLRIVRLVSLNEVSILRERIEALQEEIDELLATYGGDAGFSLSSDDDGYVQQTVVLSRLETDEEYAERIAHEDAKKAEQRSIREAQYLKLKAEFEDKQK